MMGYEVVDYGDGESTVANYQKGSCDICLLDIGLPKIDGYTVIQELHDISPDLPVIFVTGKDTKEDRIKGFKMGCDDYVTKPFSTEELLLRIEAILRRCHLGHRHKSIQKETIFHIGDFVLDYSELKLTKEDKVRLLTRKEAQLLKLLYEHRNRLVPREILLKEIWGDSKAAMGRSLDVFLSKVRTYLKSDGDDNPENLLSTSSRKVKYKPGHEPKIEVINVHGTGYMMKIHE
jgi:DNA-binding response OmpR family regulator